MALIGALLTYWKVARHEALRDVAEHACVQTNASFRVIDGAAPRASQDAMLIARPTSRLPFVIEVNQWDPEEISLKTGEYTGGRKLYLWFFGLKLRLPHEAPVDKPIRDGTYMVATFQGRIYKGAIFRETDDEIVLRVWYPDGGIHLPRDSIELIRRVD